MLIDLLGYSSTIFLASCAGWPMLIAISAGHFRMDFKMLSIFIPWFIGEWLGVAYVGLAFGFDAPPLLLNYGINAICLCVLLFYYCFPRR